MTDFNSQLQDFLGDGYSDVAMFDSDTRQLGFANVVNGDYAGDWKFVGFQDTVTIDSSYGDIAGSANLFGGNDNPEDFIFRDIPGNTLSIVSVEPGGALQGWTVPLTNDSANWDLLTHNGRGAFFGTDSDALAFHNSVTGQVGAITFTASGNVLTPTWHQMGFIDPTWHFVGSGDFAGSEAFAGGDALPDGVDDMLWSNDAGDMMLTLVRSDGTIVDDDAHKVVIDHSALNPDYRPLDVGNFDMNSLLGTTDGIADIVFENTTQTGDYGVFVSDGAGQLPDPGDTTANQHWLDFNLGANWTYETHADYNGDGVEDLLWSNNQTGQVGYTDMAIAEQGTGDAWHNLGFISNAAWHIV